MQRKTTEGFGIEVGHIPLDFQDSIRKAQSLAVEVEREGFLSISDRTYVQDVVDALDAAIANMQSADSKKYSNVIRIYNGLWKQLYLLLSRGKTQPQSVFQGQGTFENLDWNFIIEHGGQENIDTNDLRTTEFVQFSTSYKRELRAMALYIAYTYLARHVLRSHSLALSRRKHQLNQKTFEVTHAQSLLNFCASLTDIRAKGMSVQWPQISDPEYRPQKVLPDAVTALVGDISEFEPKFDLTLHGRLVGKDLLLKAMYIYDIACARAEKRRSAEIKNGKKGFIFPSGDEQLLPHVALFTFRQDAYLNKIGGETVDPRDRYVFRELRDLLLKFEADLKGNSIKTSKDGVVVDGFVIPNRKH